MRRPYILGAATFVASLAIFLALAHAYGCTQIGGRRHAWDRGRIAATRSRRNAEPDQTVALSGIGNSAYFGGRPVIDMLGKTDLHIARTRPKKQRWVGHQKDDPDYVMGRRPDFELEGR